MAFPLRLRMPGPLAYALPCNTGPRRARCHRGPHLHDHMRARQKTRALHTWC